MWIASAMDNSCDGTGMWDEKDGFEAMMSFQVKPDKGWGWALFSGILSVLLGVMIWSQFPVSGA